MKEPIWVLQDTVMAVHQMLLVEHGGLSGIRDRTLLDSALARPQQRYAYGDNVSIFELAASYSYGLATNHPFVDGNKRVALTTAAIFLEVNEYSLEAPEAETVLIFEKLAAGNLSENDLAIWLQDSSSLKV
jgi:death-on-curing protein